MKKLPDTIAACNLIKSQRNTERKTRKGKTISINIMDGIASKIKVQINLNTQHISICSCLRIAGADIAPSINPSKLRCTNMNALKQLYNHRERGKMKHTKYQPGQFWSMKKNTHAFCTKCGQKAVPGNRLCAYHMRI